MFLKNNYSAVAYFKYKNINYCFVGTSDGKM